MTPIDWKALKPHVPLSPGAPEYVERKGSAGDEIAQWILADRSPLLVGGPAGVGKSTELARAAEVLKRDRIACLVQVDRFENMRRLTPDRLLLRIAEEVYIVARNQTPRLPLSDSLKNKLAKALDEAGDHETTTSVLLNAMLSEILRVSRQKRVTLLVDGLEKVPQGSAGLDLFETLGAIRDEVELVVVIPWHAAFGPQAETVIRTGERFIAARALEVHSEPDREMLQKMLLQRLHWGPGELDAAGPDGVAKRDLVYAAIDWSGGLPRVFLQLLADAGAYAKLRRSDPWPIAKDLDDARADQVDSFRRLLLPGDVSAMQETVGSTGRELELERKVRLMAHGVLLERMRHGAPVLEVHPLVRAAF